MLRFARRKVLSAGLGLGLGLGAGCGPAPPCRSLRGVQRAALAPMGCASPVGLCTQGAIAETGVIDGPTTFVAESMAQRAGLGDGVQVTTLSYSGRLTITTPLGSLSLDEVGIFDTGYPDGLFVSRDVVTGGSGGFAGATGHLAFRGIGLNAFDNELGGELCLAD